MLVADDRGRIVYFNQAVTSLIGLQPGVEGEPVVRFLPELDWECGITKVTEARRSPSPSPPKDLC